MRAIKKPKAFMDGYRTYDTATGFGSVGQWRRAWESMGHDEAVAVMANDDPLSILGLNVLPDTLAALRKVYRKCILAQQENLRADATVAQQEQAKKIIAAFSLLEARYKC